MKFKLGDFERVRPIFDEYLTTKKDYKPNKHNISAEIIETVNTHLEEYREDHGYVRMNTYSKLEKTI